MTKHNITERTLTGVVLAIIGGMMDAYSYVYRGHVFANAQTGNIMLCGIKLSEGDFASALSYLLPILAFSCGVAVSYTVRRILSKNEKNTFQWIILIANAFILISVAFLPNEYDMYANCMISLTCGAQLASFPIISGNTAATTMCIGNLQKMIGELVEFFSEKNTENLKKSIVYALIIVAFIFGAIVQNLLIKLIGSFAIVAGGIASLCLGIIIYADTRAKT